MQNGYSSTDWSYSSSDSWQGKCKRKNQSPINLDSEITTESESTPLISFEQFSFHDLSVKSESKEQTSLRLDSFGSLIYNSTYYASGDILFKIPSEHTIDHREFDMEMQLLFHSQSYGYVDQNAVVSLLFRIERGRRNLFFEGLIHQMSESYSNVTHITSISRLIDAQKAPLYMYKGSIPYPPCDEVLYFITRDPIAISESYIRYIKVLLKIEAYQRRKIQDSSKREIWRISP
jgi:carbonic anhydrase